jgi:biopolymer transport protein TolR
VQIAELVTKLQAIAQNNPERRIFVRGDKELAYGRIMEVMGTITQGGFTKVALLAEQPAATPPAPKPPAASGSAAPPSATPAAPSAQRRQGHG